MKAVMPNVPQHILQQRARTGADRWDEVWEGVLHMPPAPSLEHQDLTAGLVGWLRTHWATAQGNRVHMEVNLAPPGGWPNDYRIPDLLLLTPESFGIDRNEYFEGAPTVVIEIRSPGDETIEKMPFSAQLGVPEVWIVDRDTKAPELYLLRERQYRRQPPGADGWLPSAATGIRLRGEPGNRLSIQIADDDRTRQLLPDG
jgi:Uma2 family endonuclease